MSDVENGIAAYERENSLRALHRDSGLWDNTLLERYATRQDLVAFVDETHRATPAGDVGYYGMSVVVFHADELPEIRRDLESIAGGGFWHSKEAFKDSFKRPRIGEMNEYIASRTAMPAIVFDVRGHEIADAQERAVRDVCLDRALRVLDAEGINDVVLDQFHESERHNVQLDQAIITSLRATGAVDEGMWMHHARMSEEHALWTADTVAWSVQRHHFGQQDRDSQHVAPLRDQLREIHAETGRSRPLPTAARVDLTGPEGRRPRRAPVYSLAQRVDAARVAAARPTTAEKPAGRGVAGQPVAARGNGRQQEQPPARPRQDPDMPKAPPVQRPEGPSRSL